MPCGCGRHDHDYDPGTTQGALSRMLMVLMTKSMRVLSLLCLWHPLLPLPLPLLPLHHHLPLHTPPAEIDLVAGVSDRSFVSPFLAASTDALGSEGEGRTE